MFGYFLLCCLRIGRRKDGLNVDYRCYAFAELRTQKIGTYDKRNFLVEFSHPILKLINFNIITLDIMQNDESYKFFEVAEFVIAIFAMYHLHYIIGDIVFYIYIYESLEKRFINYIIY